MEDHSRAATLEDLRALVRSLNEHQVDYLLIGGYALFAHGYHRATTDIDLLVRADANTARRIKQALLVLPDRAARAIDADPAQGRISVLSPVGTSLLGLEEGETAEWLTPDGRRHALRLVRILYQPEASGDYLR